jgi:hypothetical protein
MNLNGIHQPEIDQYSTSGRDRSAISPGSGTPDGQRDSVFTGKGKDFKEMFFSGGLKNKVGEALQHQVADQRREVYVEVIAVILEFLRITNHSQARIPA